MDINLLNYTKTSHTINTPTIVWCFLMPLIHFLSLISNILCIIVFCSKTFIHKPIAIYFICLLISDSTTLLIGYTEMLDRESHMINKASGLCMFNEKIIHSLTNFFYTFMGRFCLEWMLYKVLWTRASTILLAILSIQRSRTFFSLSYRESRLCALFACIISVLIALLITCFEWIGIQCEKSNESYVYIEILELLMKKKNSKQFYSDFLYEHYNTSIENYYCIVQSLDINQVNMASSVVNQFNCSTNAIASQFYSLTQSLISNPDPQISESMTHILINIYDDRKLHANTSLLIAHIHQAKSVDILIKLFDKRSCHITLTYSICLKIYDFLHSLSFAFNRHTLAIFFGNALPSFIVFSANLLSLKVIYFSKSLRYLKQTTRTNRRKRRLKNDLRAFLVILIESFSVITISWGIPIFLTMYHCHTLYVVSISACPQIKKSLAFFLFTDLFNSSTNCLLYSLSGKLFRRKFISIIKAIFTCGRGTLWHAPSHSLLLPSQQIELQPSNDPSANHNHVNHSRVGSYRHSELFPVTQLKKLQNLTKNKRSTSDDNSFSMVRISDEQNGCHETESQLVKKIQMNSKVKNTRSFKSFFINKVRSFGSTGSTQRKIKLKKKSSSHTRQPTKANNVSWSSSSGSIQQSINRRYTSKIILTYTEENQLITKTNLVENVSSL